MREFLSTSGKVSKVKLVSISSFGKTLEFQFIHNEFSPFNIAIVASSLLTSFAK
jgi:hypothetical protein